MTARRALLLVALLAGACGGPKGPDGADFPTVPPRERRNIRQPPYEGLARVIEEVRAKKTDAPDEQRGAFELNGVQIQWERTEGGCRISLRSEGNPTFVFVVRRVTPAAGVPTVEVVTIESGNPRGGQHWGPEQTFYGFAPDCADVVWVQYVQRRTRYFSPDGAEAMTRDAGPEIDEQTPYAIQSQPALGTALMQDDPGVVAPLGVTVPAAAPGALAEVKRLDGVQSDATKVIAVWRFWSYLVCEDPRRVLGHLAWGFTLTIDINTAPYISVSDVTGPAWQPQPAR